MKKTFAIVLVLAFALTLGVVALAEGLSEEEPMLAETTEIVDEAAETVAQPADEETAETDVEVGEEPVVEAAPIEDETVEAPANEGGPLIPHPEAISLEDWMRMRNPSIISEDEWMLCYVMNHRIQSWYDGESYELPAEIAEKYGTTDYERLPLILVFTSVGELDSVEVIEVGYYSDQVDENGNHFEWSETVAIEIPAGETVFYVMEDPGEGAHCGGFGTVAGAYGDLYVGPVEW